MNAPDDNKVVLYFGDGRGNFPGPDIEIEDVTQPYGMDAGDLNRDGKLDAAVCGVSNTPGQSVVTVMLGDGAGGFTNSTYPVGDLPSSVKIGDLNNDGIPDLVVAGALPGNATGNYITTFLGNGRGVFALSQTVQVGEGNLKGDIALGHSLKVNQTPTFFLNGVKIDGMWAPQFFEQAIAYELKRAQ